MIVYIDYKCIIKNKRNISLGSGKTLAFLIPILQILKQREVEEKWEKHQIGAVVVSPTRELALQTKDVLDRLLAHVKVSLTNFNDKIF